MQSQKNRITTELPNGNKNFEEDDTVWLKNSFTVEP